jgi:hypothetical protein
MPRKTKNITVRLTDEDVSKFKDQILLVLFDYPKLKEAIGAPKALEIATRIINNLQTIAGSESK